MTGATRPRRSTNPDELRAAAHAGCFSMALSKILDDAKLKAEKLETNAEVTLEQVEGGFAITAVHLVSNASVPGADRAKLEELAGQAKAGRPVSKRFDAKITLHAKITATA